MGVAAEVLARGGGAAFGGGAKVDCAAAIIAGALFGFTGQGMQWLQRIDGLVENDQKIQR